MAVIEVDSVTKRFPDGTLAVDSADFTIEDGEFFILVGPSGCGKSTLLNMIVGLEDISEGTLKIGDRVVNDLDPKDRNLAMVFQNYALYPHLSVRENMAFPLRLKKVPDEEVKRRVDEAARFCAQDRLAISPQCGFASSVAGNPISEDDQKRKLSLVVETAVEIWGSA